MLTDNTKQYYELIKLTKNGIETATFVQIKDALIARFKEIYGSDIEISNESTDGQYIHTIAMMINNMLMSIQSFYSSIDPQTATGKYLEILCSFTNAIRQDATKSLVSVIVTNRDTVSHSSTSITFIDSTSNTWTWNSENDEELEFEPGIPQVIQAECDTFGPISLFAGSQIMPVSVSDAAWMTCEIEDDAEEGSYQETDSSLRARRNDTMSSNAYTVLESLQNALVKITGITDCKIFNNNTNENMTLLDGAVIKPHSIYVILRQKDLLNITDSKIGSVIYEKLTPGIHTNSAESSLFAEARSYNYPIDESIKQIVYWKKAKKENPEIKITIKPNEYYTTAKNKTAQEIIDDVVDYCNGLSLCTDLTIFDIQSYVLDADPEFKGRRTYSIQSITINGLTNDYISKGAYYEYLKTQTIENVGEDVVITIK